MKIDFRIMGVPSRKDNIEVLKRQLGITDASVFLDTEYRRNPMWTWKQTARLQGNPDATHLCIVQDDAVLPERFTDFCEYLVRRFPDAIWLLYNDFNMKNKVPLYCVVQPNTCTGGAAIIVPNKYINRIIESQEQKYPDYIHDDNWICYWAHQHDVEVYCPFPSVVNTQGNGLHENRNAEYFCNKPMLHHWANATSVKWSKKHDWTKPMP